MLLHIPMGVSDLVSFAQFVLLMSMFRVSNTVLYCTYCIVLMCFYAFLYHCLFSTHLCIRCHTIILETQF